MDPADIKTRNERDETDASLLAERTKTDVELTRTQVAIEDDADQAVCMARDRAEEVLREARDLADHSRSVPASVARERAAEDDTVAEEHAAADEQLRVDREERQGALAALLRLEREATDEGLEVERALADEAVASRDDFLGVVSHDLRSMLGGIAVSASSLASHANAAGADGEQTIKHIDRIQRFTARMNRLLGDLLDVVSLEAGALYVDPAPHDVVKVVNDAAEAFQLSFSAKGVGLAIEAEAGPIVATFDDQRILQVLANLLINALKFTPRDGKVTLSVARSDDEVCVSVIDTGVGIPEGAEETIFERFRQGAAQDRRGVGLGLYIAKSIVDAHAGRVWATRPAAGGAALHFTLPLSR